MKSCIENIQVGDILLMWVDRNHAFVVVDSEEKIQIEEYPVLEREGRVLWVVSHCTGTHISVFANEDLIEDLIVGVKKKRHEELHRQYPDR